jgi:hypothetical protein
VSDVLSVTVELSGNGYPTKNREGKDGFRGGRKSDVYREVAILVEDAARAEMERIGWTMATCECAGIVMRVVPKRWKSDALNIGTAEANALTAAGVWTDDQACSPAIKYVRYDSEGPHRIVIVVVKLHQPVATEIKAIAPRIHKPATPKAAKAKPERIKSASSEIPLRVWKPGNPVPDGYALEDGKLISRDRALAMIRGEK